MIGGLRDKSRYLIAGTSVLAILAFSAPAAKATDVQQLEATMRAMQAQMEALRREVQEAKAAASAKSAKKDDELDLKVKWRGAPEFSSGDGKFKMKIRGRIHADYQNIDQDTPITFAPDISATVLRRARIGVEGVLYYDFKYVFEVDFANNATVVRDAYLQYTAFDVQPIIGNFKTYNSLEQLMSSNYRTFMENAAFITAFGIDRQIGAGLGYAKEHFTLSAGIFGESVGSSPLFLGFTGEENVTASGRITVAPINREVNGVNQVLHLGASGRWREAGDDQPFLQYATPGTNLSLANVFNTTGRIGESDTMWGFEGAAVWGPLSVQGEYAQTDVDLPGGAVIRNTSTGGAAGTPPYFGSSVNQIALINNPFLGVPNPSYTGWYLDASYFLTGETRPYKDGIFGRVKVKNPVQWGKGKGGWGAWQIAGRYDFLDLSDGAFNAPFPGDATNYSGGCPYTRLGVNQFTAPLPNVAPPAGGGVAANPARLAQCGEQDTWIIGVNWYLTDYTRIMFNYMQTELSGYPLTLTTANNTPGLDVLNTPVRGFDGATIRGFGTRVQVDW